MQPITLPSRTPYPQRISCSYKLDSPSMLNLPIPVVTSSSAPLSGRCFRRQVFKGSERILRLVISANFQMTTRIRSSLLSRNWLIVSIVWLAPLTFGTPEPGTLRTPGPRTLRTPEPGTLRSKITVSYLYYRVYKEDTGSPLYFTKLSNLAIISLLLHGWRKMHWTK